jgi:hypothetical protein
VVDATAVRLLLSARGCLSDREVIFSSPSAGLERPNRSMMRPCLAALLVGFAAPVHASEPPTRFSLNWVRLPGAESCISARALSERVEARLRRAVFSAPALVDVVIEGHVKQTEAGFVASVSISDAAGAVLGSRELTTADSTCRDLDAQLALTVALLIDPNAELETPPPAAPPPVEKRPPPAQRAIREPETRASTENPFRSTALVGGGIGFGLLPKPSPALVVRIGLRPPHSWPIVFDGAFFREQDETPPSGSAPVAFSLKWAGASTCPVSADSRLTEWQICAGFDAGILSTRGLADASVLVHNRFILALAARGEGVLHLGSHFLFGVAASVEVPVVRDEFEYERNAGREHVFRPAPVGAVFDATLGFRAP